MTNWCCYWPVRRGGAERLALFNKLKWISDHRRQEGMSPPMPEEVWRLSAASHLLLLLAPLLSSLPWCIMSLIWQGAHESPLLLPYCLCILVIRITTSQMMMMVKGHRLVLQVIAGEMAKDRLTVAVWVTLEVFGSLPSQSQRWRCFPSSKT